MANVGVCPGDHDDQGARAERCDTTPSVLLTGPSLGAVLPRAPPRLSGANGLFDRDRLGDPALILLTARFLE